MKFTQEDIGCDLVMSKKAIEYGLGPTPRKPLIGTAVLTKLLLGRQLIRVRQTGCKHTKRFHEDFWDKK